MNTNQIIFFAFLFYMFPKISWTQAVMMVLCMISLLLFTIFKCQEKILYLNEMPPKTPEENPMGFRHPGEAEMPYSDVWLTASDGTRLHCWWLPQDEKKGKERTPTIVFYHANAGNMGLRLPHIYMLYHRLGANIFLLSYRGYGKSEGEPDEDGIKLDAQAALDHVLKRDDVDKDHVYVYGQSLGGAVAAFVAHHNKDTIRALVLENTFTSIRDMVGQVFPLLNFGFIKDRMLRLRWDTDTLIGNVECPILFLAGAKDEVVPHWQMQSLHENAKRASKKDLLVIDEGDHNTMWLKYPRYWEKLKEFVSEFSDVPESSNEKPILEAFSALQTMAPQFFTQPTGAAAVGTAIS